MFSVAVLAAVLAVLPARLFGQETREVPASSTQHCDVIQIALPVTLESSQQVQQSLQAAVGRATAATSIKRPIAILEFAVTPNRSGVSSDFGACYSLAKLLTSPELKRLRTVAYIPGHASATPDANTLTGHAVLVAIAANEIAMGENASIGAAGAEGDNEAYLREIYAGIANKRLTLPLPMVLSMFESGRGLYYVKTKQGVQFVDAASLEALETAGQVIESTTLATTEQLAVVSSEQLESLRLIKFRSKTKADLARSLGLSPDQLVADASAGKAWVALRIEMPEVLTDRSVRWMKRAIRPALQENQANLLILEFDDATGNPDPSIELAEFVANLDPAEVKSVAVVQQSVRSGAAIVGLACDQILMQKSSQLGGFPLPVNPGDLRDGAIAPAEKDYYRSDIQSIAAKKGKSWSLMMAMIDAESDLSAYRDNKNGAIRLLSSAEHQSLDNVDRWQLHEEMGIDDGLSAQRAKQKDVASSLFNEIDEVKSFYQLSAEPILLAPTKTDLWIESLAAFLTSPAVTPFLLMGAFFFISTEVSAPGLGLPGFLGALCLLAFFWSQNFDGNAEWFEILLFFVGLVFILLEIFVIPGFGIFGIGGIVMMGISIVLAAQSFILPMTVRDLERLPNSLFPLIGGAGGIIMAAIVLPRVIPNAPFLKHLVLAPREKEDTGLETTDAEAVVDYGYLNGSIGEAVTQIMPSGRAMFGDQICDVITDGQVIDKGEKVRVIEAVANRVVVERLV